MAIEVSAWRDIRLDARLAGGHRNEVWSGWSPTGRVAVRRSRRPADSLAWELDLLAVLDGAGLLVPVVVPTDAGLRCDGDVVVQRWIDGREPTSDEDWLLVADELRRLHRELAGYPQRHGCRAVGQLVRSSVSGDADLSALPDDVADEVLAVFAVLADAPVSLVHGDPSAANLRITPDGKVGLLDWDESRVDVVDLDLANLGVQVLNDEQRARALDVADAWEATNAWLVEPAYARNRYEALKARRAEQRGA